MLFYLNSNFKDNDDGILDERDKNFNKIVLWYDYNANGITEEGEIKPLSHLNIKAFLLNSTKSIEKTINGNLIVEKVAA